MKIIKLEEIGMIKMVNKSRKVMMHGSCFRDKMTEIIFKRYGG